MKKIIIIFLSMSMLYVVGGCSNRDTVKVQLQEEKSSSQVSDNYIREIILSEFQQWEGTPHKMGGNSKKGIDCSGFAYYMYGELFNIKVPRTTKLFLREGAPIC